MLNALKVITEESSALMRNVEQMQRTWLQEAMPASEDQPSVAAATGMAQHAMKVNLSLNRNAQRQLYFWQSHLPNMLTAAQNPTVFGNLLAFQSALTQRMTQQFNTWVHDWQHLLHDAGEGHGANTMSKLMEQEYNIVARMSALQMAHVSAVAQLLENAQVDLAYLLSQGMSAEG